MHPDPDAQPRPSDYGPPAPEHVRPHPKGKPTAEEVDAYVRELERRLRIGKEGEEE